MNFPWGKAVIGTKNMINDAHVGDCFFGDWENSDSIDPSISKANADGDNQKISLSQKQESFMFIFGDGCGASFLEHFVHQEFWVCGVSDIEKCKF